MTAWIMASVACALDIVAIVFVVRTILMLRRFER